MIICTFVNPRIDGISISITSYSENDAWIDLERILKSKTGWKLKYIPIHEEE